MGNLWMVLGLAVVSFISAGILDTMPVNTWTRIASSPGDPRGREVAPGHASTWVYEPNVGKFFRYGGFTPAFTNALYSFDPESLTWAVVWAHDETFPAGRPGGGSNWSLMYDSVRKAIWITGGFHSWYSTGDQGVWLYFAKEDSFARMGDPAYPMGTYHAYDPVHDLMLATPPPSKMVSNANQTLLFSPASNSWTAYPTSVTLQEYHYGNFPTVFDASLGKFVAFRMLVEYGVAQNTRVWTFDPVVHQWEVLDSASVFPSRQYPAVAYDPLHQVVFLYGGMLKTETWVYLTALKTWTRISVPGLPSLNVSGLDAVFFPQALAWDPVHACMLLNDPDLGVWAFKYDPVSPAGTALLNAESLAIGRAAAEPPAPGPAEAALTSFPSPLNQRLLDMPDNSLLLMNSGSGTGNEITWHFDPDDGVLLRYGGCGNNSSPYWSGYGNNLDLYDPGLDRWVCRRTGEISGADRPRNGCTRSVLYDTRRKEWHFFGGTGSGPYNPPYLSSYTYDVGKDSFTYKASEGTMPLGHVGCVLSYDADHDVTIFPDSAKVYVFHFETGLWETRNVWPSPGRLDVYQRTAYVSSIGKFMAVQPRIIGSDSLLDTWIYDPETNQWDSLTGAVRPPYRACKYGLAYDSLNDVVLLVGGQVRWGGTNMNDMWIYHPRTNAWEEVGPAPAGGNFPGGENMCTAYDSRHNVFLIGQTYAGPLLAYRYKQVPLETEKKPDIEDAGILASPNPFNPSVVLTLSGALASGASIKVYDLSGKRVADLSKGISRGKAVWNASGLASGLYVAVVQKGMLKLTRKVVYSK